MFRILFSVLMAGAPGLVASSSTVVATLLDSAAVQAIGVDSANNVFLAGNIRPAERQSEEDFADAFVAKLSPDGSEVLFWTLLAGSKSDTAYALAVDTDGAVYVTGVTYSRDFLTTEEALQTEFQAENSHAFVVKLDAEGRVQYSTLLGGTSRTIGFALIVNGRGEALVSGQTLQGEFPVTPGAAVASTDSNTRFVAKIDATGSELLMAVRGVGGSALATDAEDNVYVAGQVFGSGEIPITEGAFQPSHEHRPCGGSGLMGISCSYGYVTKLTGDGTEVLFSTFVTGSYGSRIAAIDIDASGNVLIAGTTNSPDYPVTSGVLIDQYIASAPSPPHPGSPKGGPFFPPPASGFVTKLNSTGTGLLYSTYFSGTQTDTVTDMAVDGDFIQLAGVAQSPDLLGRTGSPEQCIPSSYVTRLTADGTAVTGTQLVKGIIPDVAPWLQGGGGRLALAGPGESYVAGLGNSVFLVDFSAQTRPITCVDDAANLFPATSVSPGQLLSIFGRRLAENAQVFRPDDSGFFPRSPEITFNDLPAPVLYSGPRQINVQVPFEIAGDDRVTMRFRDDSRNFALSGRRPSVFLRTPAEPTCNRVTAVRGGGFSPLALNADGSRNTCAQPAAPGSVVTIFLQAVGVTNPPLVTGAIAPSPATPLDLPVDSLEEIVSAETLPGSISGVWRVQFRIPHFVRRFLVLNLEVDSIPVTPGSLVFWVEY
ncbi:MAG: hypothetical protein GY953_05065 [bacterium]|nr:hypothetical protein [bacterium]